MVIVAVLLVLCSPSRSQQIRTPTGPLVKLSLFAVDAKNQSVDAITKEDLRVVESKLEQNLLSVELDERPLDIMIALDASESFDSKLPHGIEAAKLIINNRRPTDEVAIISFTDQIDTIQDFTINDEVLLQRLSIFRIQHQRGPTAIIDAVYLAADHLAKHKSGEDRRKALIVITDGQNSGGKYKYVDLIKALQQNSVPVFAFGPMPENGYDWASMLEKEGLETLKDLAAETGGRVFIFRSPKELQEMAQETVRGLRRSFLITYRSSDNNGRKGFRKVQVKAVSASKKKVIAMPGYFFAGEAAVSNKTP